MPIVANKPDHKNMHGIIKGSLPFGGLVQKRLHDI